MPLDLPPPLAARYRPLRLLGTGGFGAVYEVERVADGATLALKTFPVATDAARVERELKAATGFTHPHLVRAYEGRVLDGHAYLEMEVADGSLRDLFLAAQAGDDAAYARAWGHLPQVALGLQALAGRGWVHRDLKPENVLLVGGVAKIADLGLARGRGLETLTATGIVVGTPRYMAPEQAQGLKPTPAVDVFAFGAMVVELLAGTVPWDTPHPVETVMRLARGEARLPPRVASVLPPEALRLLEGCLEIDPDRRLSDLGELARAWARRPPPRPAPLGSPAPAPGLEPTAPVPAVTPPGRRETLVPAGTATPKGISAAPAPSRGRGLVATALLLALAAASYLAPAAKPPAPEAPRPAPAEVPLEALRRELEAADLRFLMPGGEVFEEADRPPKARSLTDGDPAHWADLVYAVPSLGASLRALRAAPWGRSLSSEERAGWAAADQLFLSRSLPAPFGPLLPPSPPDEAGRGPAGLIPQLDEIRRVFTARKQALLAHLAGDQGSDVPADLVEYMRLVSSYIGLRDDQLLTEARAYWPGVRARQAMVRWMGTEPLVRRLLYDVRHLLTQESPELEAFAVRLDYDLSNCAAAYSVEALDLPAQVHLPPGDLAELSPAAALIGARLTRLRRALRSFAAETKTESERTFIQYLQRASQVTPNTSLESQADRRTIADLELVAELSGDDHLEAAQRTLLGITRDPTSPIPWHQLIHHARELLERLYHAPERILPEPEKSELRGLYQRCLTEAHPAPDHQARYRGPYRVWLEAFDR